MEKMNQQLHEAASSGKIKIVEKLLKQGSNINQTDQDGNTPLHTAVLYGQETVIEYLITHGADVEKATPNGQTPLHLSASLGHAQAVTFMLSHGANLDKEDKDGYSALNSNVRNGHLDVVRYFISQGAKVHQGNTKGLSSLHTAAGYGKLEVVKYLLSQGAEVNKRYINGGTALHMAAQNGHLDVTKYLISRGVEVNGRDNIGWTALHDAALYGRIDVTKYLISQGAEVNGRNDMGRTALHNASRSGALDISKYLISQGADLNRGDNKGMTALHHAAQKGRLDVTEYLISQGAEVNGRDNMGCTALHDAAHGGHLDVIRYLISQGAELNNGNNDGSTPVYIAAHEGHLEIIKYLISQGAEVNNGDNDSCTALHSAAHEGHLDVTEYPISQGAEVNKGDNGGCTALHIAALNGRLDVTKSLISQGAELNKRGNDGSTALHSAVQEGHLAVTKYLLVQGISVNMSDRNGYTPLHIAALKGDVDTIKVLLEERALVDVKDTNGQTPLHLSTKTGSANSSDILAKHAKINGILDHRDDEGLTALHLATQNGHTPVVESLVNHGASLNIQSHDGTTCLHEAIRLSDHTVRKMQTNGKPQQISEDSYQHDLSPEKALVLYLLEHGAKLDIRDSEGKLPIHYATNEVIRQVIFSRLPSIEMITRYRDEEAIPLVTVSAQVDNGGKQIQLADLGISMSIPLGAVKNSDSCKITLTRVQDSPSINSQGGESVACYGIRCDPLNMIFHQPVKIKIPHSACIVNSDQLKPDIVWRVWDSPKDLPRTSRKRSSSSPDEPPYCKVYKRHIELYIGHCAEWWVLIPLEQQVIRHQLLCTPYIPDRIERGSEFEVHLQMHTDLPGIETDIHEENKQQSYHKSHRSVPFSVESKSGDVTVTCHREGEQVESKVLSLPDVYSKMRHIIILSVTPTEDDVESTEITITITQAGKLGVSRSIAFIIRRTDGPEYQSPSEPTSFLRAVEEVSRSELPDIDVLAIAQTMTVDHFYDLGVALGFTIQQLDAIEHRRFHDREQAIYDMLVIWRERQPSGQAAKETFLSLMASSAEEIAISGTSDIGPTGEISDRTLVAFARQIRPKMFHEIGGKLGFKKSDLQHIEHRTLYNRKDTNVQMLSMWKASQTSGPKAKQTLKLVWDSVHDASKAEKTKDEEDEEVPVQELEGNSTSPPEQRPEQSESVEPEDMEIIINSDSGGDETSEDIDLRGGSPSTGEQCSVALSVNSLSLALELGKALRLDDDVIVGFVAPSEPASMKRLALQLLNKWCRRFGIQEKKGRDEISKKICTTPDLLDLSQRLDLAGSEILQVMSTSVSFPPTSIRHIVLQMLQEWVRHGGTRKRLLEITKAFHFNDAADKIATGMEQHPGFLDLFSHGIIDHDGGELKLDELDITVSIPAGAIPKGMRSVVTLSVPSRCSSKIPLKDGDVLITPIIECSFTQELLKPATVALPHCIHPEQHQDDLRVSLYTKLGPDEFGYRSLLPNTSRGVHISEDMIGFSTRYLQLWGLSSNNVRGVQFTCEVFQPLFMLPSQKSTLRIRIAHPCNRYPADMCSRQGSLLEPFYQVATMFKFSLESKEDDLELWCLSDSEKVQEKVPVRCLLNGKCNTSSFELMSSHAEGGAKNIYVRIDQGTSTLAEQQIPTSTEVEPDYGVSHTRDRIKIVSDNMLNILPGLVCSMKDARDLGYQLGFSHSTVEKYLDRADSSASSVSSSGFKEMLHDWRRRVRPSEQVKELRLALKEAGLSYTAEVLFYEY